MNVLEYFKPVTTFVFDVDGVLTDGTLLVMPDGLMARRMNIKDGYALQLAVKKGYRVIVISGGISPHVQERLIKLGVNEVFMGIKDKLYCLKEYLSKNSLQQEEVMFMGDDIPDYEVMLNVGLPCCPIDAVSEIKSISKYISPFKGGEGCGRDVIEKVLKLRGTWSIDTKIKSQ
jgi:3-deoxy-D-manno-octulosonate 8-phosphate phosphatase (KDO 8-P phosphatase)